MPEKPEIDVGYVAQLARIELTPAETELFQRQLSKVLEYAAQLQRVNLLEIEQPSDGKSNSVVRLDLLRPSFSTEEALRNAPQQSRGLFLVPRVLE